MSETVVEADYFFHGGVFSGHILAFDWDPLFLNPRYRHFIYG
jgi:hypothetical protein